MPHFSLRQGLLLWQLSLCLICISFLQIFRSEMRACPQRSPPIDFWEQFSESQRQTTKSLAMSHNVSFEGEAQLLFRVKSKLCHRQGRNAFFFDAQAFQLMTVQHFTQTKLTCKSKSCHRQGRDTLATYVVTDHWSVQKMSMLSKIVQDGKLEN